MEHKKLVEELEKANLTGWVVRGEKIVLWENSDPVPAKYTTYVELDATE
jgi:hypothetical protein